MPSNKTIRLDGGNLSIEEIGSIVADPRIKVTVTNRAMSEIKASYAFLVKNLKDQVIYGINTGFGPMASYILSPGQLNDLQLNLVRSHAVGMGEPIPTDFVLAAMVVRLNTLCKGMSGVSPELIGILQKFINNRIVPVVPEHGAVGTSGDLVQLAHIALALVGEGEVIYKGIRQPTEKVLARVGLKPYCLKPKEGLSLVNGTSMMSGIASVLLIQAQSALDLAIANGALAMEVVNAFDDGISMELSAARPHAGQIHVAQKLREIVRSSKLLRSRDNFFKEFEFKDKDDVVEIPETVQEVYSLRCIPQILGPIYDTLQMAKHRVGIEINSATDNPLVLAKKKKFLHGGNFHGDYISAAVDQLKLTMVKLTMLSERQINFFMNRNINKFFPPFMNLKKPGLTLGLQGMQFVATSTTAQNQAFSTSLYVHSIPTNADNQDVVSMGTDAAMLLSRVMDNVFIVLSIGSLTLCQAVDYLRCRRQLSGNSSYLYKTVRKSVPTVLDDRVVYPELDKLSKKLKNFNAA